MFYVRCVLMPTIRGASADLNRIEPRILADFKVLNESPIFTALPREKNAEHFISGFISWTGEGVKPLKNAEHDRLLDLLTRFERAASTDEAWSSFLKDDALGKLDLAWLDQLIAYDHIDFGTHREQEALLSKVASSNSLERISIAATLPLPEMRELRFAALARVAQLQKENRAAEAASLFRHVAYLMSTTDSLIGSMMAVSMLSDEKNLASRTHAEWSAIDDGKLQAFRRASWAWIGIERLRAAKNDLGVYEPFLNRATGACLGSFETISVANQLQDFFAPTAPFEFDLRERLVKIDLFQRRLLDLCGHDDLKVFLAPVKSESNPLIIQRYHPNIARVPFLRRIVGLTLLSAAMPNYFGLYEANPRQPASEADPNTPHTK